MISIPLSQIPITICNHRFGAKMTFSHQTDSRFLNSVYAAEMFGFKNNIRLGDFTNNLLSGQQNGGVKEAEATGLMRHDMYLGNDLWKNPITGSIERIPNYYDSTWSSLGAQYFPVTAGDAKTAKWPNHGLQMYLASNGQYGYDVQNHLMGTTQLSEWFGVLDAQQTWLSQQTGRRFPVAGSHRNGYSGTAPISWNKLIGTRNSSAGGMLTNADGETWYGSNLGYRGGSMTSNLIAYFSQYPSTSRWWDYWNTFYNPLPPKVDCTAYVQSQIAKTLLNSGWYRDFCHWHSCRNTDTMPSIDEFLSICRAAFGSEFVWTCSNGEALEYMFIRELTDKVSAIEVRNEIHIMGNLVDRFKNDILYGLTYPTPLKGLNTPLCVQVDLTGTFLQGKSVKATNGKIISLGDNKYIVQLPMSNAIEGIMANRLVEGNDGIFNINRPEGNAIITGSTLTVSASMPVKCVVFSVAAGGNNYDSLVYSRNNILDTTHSFNVEPGNDYRIGIISEFQQSNLIEV